MQVLSQTLDLLPVIFTSYAIENAPTTLITQYQDDNMNSYVPIQGIASLIEIKPLVSRGSQ